MNITVTPMSAVEHAYVQRMAEWAKNQPPEEEITCLYCGNVIRFDGCDEDCEPICMDCSEERRASQHADAADRQRDERWADRIEENE